jgi:hypothetical protein
MVGLAILYLAGVLLFAASFQPTAPPARDELIEITAPVTTTLGSAVTRRRRQDPTLRIHLAGDTRPFVLSDDRDGSLRAQIGTAVTYTLSVRPSDYEGAGPVPVWEIKRGQEVIASLEELAQHAAVARAQSLTPVFAALAALAMLPLAAAMGLLRPPRLARPVPRPASGIPGHCQCSVCVRARAQAARAA